MSGGGGGIVIIKSTVNTLTDPLVHGSLPQRLQDLVDPILAKPTDQWDADDKFMAGHVYAWALTNLS